MAIQSLSGFQPRRDSARMNLYPAIRSAWVSWISLWLVLGQLVGLTAGLQSDLPIGPNPIETRCHCKQAAQSTATAAEPRCCSVDTFPEAQQTSPVLPPRMETRVGSERIFPPLTLSLLHPVSAELCVLSLTCSDSPRPSIAPALQSLLCSWLI